MSNSPLTSPGQAGRRFRHLAKCHARGGRGAPEILRKCVQHDPLVGPVFDELVGPGSHRVPHRAAGCLGLPIPFVDDPGCPGRQALFQQRVLGAGVEAHRQRVQHLDAGQHAEIGPAFRQVGVGPGHPLRREGERHVVRGQLVAIVEPHAGTQLHVQAAGRVARPALGQARHQRGPAAARCGQEVAADQRVEHGVGDPGADIGKLPPRLKRRRQVGDPDRQRPRRSPGRAGQSSSSGRYQKSPAIDHVPVSANILSTIPIRSGKRGISQSAPNSG